MGMGVTRVQRWRPLTEVARELGITGRTLRVRIKEAGIHPARPGRIAMLSDADVTTLMEHSRRRGRLSNPKAERLSFDDATHQRARNRQNLLTEIMDLHRLVDEGC
jgi:hypothetical protein